MSVRMTDRHGERIGLIEGQFTFERQNQTHHVLNLLLAGATAADQRLFNRSRRIFVHRQPGGDDRGDGRSPRLTEFQRRSRIARHEHLLNGDLMRLRLLHHSANAGKDLTQSLRKLPLRRAYAAAGDMATAHTVTVDDAEPGHPGTGIDTQYASEANQLSSSRISSEMSALVNTSCTSSRSSSTSTSLSSFSASSRSSCGLVSAS